MRRMSATVAQGALAAPGARRYSREDIVALGQAGTPWEFLPVALRALEIAPDDDGLRVLTVANLVSLGLGTIAGEHLGRVSETLAGEAPVAALGRAVRGMAPDRIDPAAVLT